MRFVNTLKWEYLTAKRGAAAVTPQEIPECPHTNLDSVTHNGLTWVHIERPSKRDAEYLAQSYPFFHKLNLEDILSRIQSPKVDEYGEHIFVVLHFPVFSDGFGLTLAGEVDFFVGKDFLVTVHCSGNLKALSEMFARCRVETEIREALMESGAGKLFYSVVDSLVDRCFPIVDQVISNIERLEGAVFRTPVPQTVREIMLARRDTLLLQRMMWPDSEVVKVLKEARWPFLGEGSDVYFSDIGDHLNRMLSSLDEYEEVAEGLSDAGNWLTSHRMQETVRVLTIFMAIIMPLTLVTGIYGMNIKLPFGNAEGGSWVGLGMLLGFMSLTAVCILFFFRRKRWL
ncbi:MAG: magnesium transporter CorA family protein [Dehalococcoidales bacterium]|nr:magnesium transporter CorA family protein [Dehalococcoidales bacterium]